MFKNKKMVALVLFAVMILAPFASAFAAAPSHNHLKNYEVAVTDASEGLEKLATDYEDALKTYSTSGKDADKKAVEDAKKAYDEKLVEVNGYKALVANYEPKDFLGATWNASEKYKAGGSDEPYTDEAAAKTALKDANDKLEAAKAKVSSEMVELYKKLGDVLAKANAASDEATKAKATLDGYAAMYTGKDESVQKIVAPYMEKAYKAFAKVATPEKAKEWLAYEPADVMEALKDIKFEAAKVLEKDGYKVWAPEAAPEALNGAVELRLTKNDKGNTLMKLYDANGKEVESKGLLYVRMPIPKGVTANKIKVDGVETTFKVVDKTWEFAAEFKIAK